MQGVKNMPFIEVKWYAGRDKATKAKTMELLTKAMCEAVGCKPEVVEIVFHDVEKYNWGTGGKPHGN
jgi:4-oxalocrotonate tautomerase